VVGFAVHVAPESEEVQIAPIFPVYQLCESVATTFVPSEEEAIDAQR